MGVVKTPEEWARRHLAQAGNINPRLESIQFYVDLVTPGSKLYDIFYYQQYNRWLMRDEEQALVDYNEKVAEASTKTLNERYIEDEDNTGPFFNLGEN